MGWKACTKPRNLLTSTEVLYNKDMNSTERVLELVRAQGLLRPRDLASLAPDAPAILVRNVYGWFDRPARGLYCLSEAGHAALEAWKDHLPPVAAEDRSSSGP